MELSLSRSDLQSLAKRHNIKANQKNATIIEELRKLNVDLASLAIATTTATTASLAIYVDENDAANNNNNKAHSAAKPLDVAPKEKKKSAAVKAKGLRTRRSNNVVIAEEQQIAEEVHDTSSTAAPEPPSSAPVETTTTTKVDSVNEEVKEVEKGKKRGARDTSLGGVIAQFPLMRLNIPPPPPPTTTTAAKTATSPDVSVHNRSELIELRDEVIRSATESMAEVDKMGCSPTTTTRRELKRKFESAIEALGEAQRLMEEQRRKMAKIAEIRKQQEELTKAESLVAEVAPEVRRVVAMYSYQGTVQGEDLDFTEGEEIEVTKVVDENWYAGKIGERIGIFPKAYVKEIAAE